MGVTGIGGFFFQAKNPAAEALIAKLRAADIEVITKPEWNAPGLGQFARIHDPEDNPIELWQPG